MINNIIDKIKESEKRSKEIIASSKKESSEIIEKAYQKGNEYVRNSELIAKNLSKDARSRAMGDVATEKIKIEEEYDKKTKSIIDNSQSREEKAIKKLTDSVLD